MDDMKLYRLFFPASVIPRSPPVVLSVPAVPHYNPLGPFLAIGLPVSSLTSVSHVYQTGFGLPVSAVNLSMLYIQSLAKPLSGYRTTSLPVLTLVNYVNPSRKAANPDLSLLSWKSSYPFYPSVCTA